MNQKLKNHIFIRNGYELFTKDEYGYRLPIDQSVVNTIRNLVPIMVKQLLKNPFSFSNINVPLGNYLEEISIVMRAMNSFCCAPY